MVTSNVDLAARTREALEEVADKIRQRSGTILAVDADISRQEDCIKIVAETLHQFGQIDALVNNAAMLGPLGLVAEVLVDEWTTRTLAVNLLGSMMMCREAVPHLRKTHGRVVNFSIAASEAVIPSGSAYWASKAALNHFSRILASEEPDLTVVMYDPGDVNTRMQVDIREKSSKTPYVDLHQYFVDQFEQGRLLSPEKAAQEIVRLALQAPHEWTSDFIHWDDT